MICEWYIHWVLGVKKKWYKTINGSLDDEKGGGKSPSDSLKL